MSIGVRPTFGSGRGELVEVYVLDFSGDLYGQQLHVDFLDRLRGERRFDSVEALVAQMALDVEDARAVAARAARMRPARPSRRGVRVSATVWRRYDYDP